MKEKISFKDAAALPYIKEVAESLRKQAIDMLQELIMAAVNEALRKGEEAREASMSKMAPGMGGLF